MDLLLFDQCALGCSSVWRKETKSDAQYGGITQKTDFELSEYFCSQDGTLPSKLTFLLLVKERQAETKYQKCGPLIYQSRKAQLFERKAQSEQEATVQLLVVEVTIDDVYLLNGQEFLV